MKIALISVHGDPRLQAGGKDAGGMNIYIREVVEKLNRSNVEVDIYTRDHNRINEIEGQFTNINVNYILCLEFYYLYYCCLGLKVTL